MAAGAQADQDFVSLWGTAEDQIVVVGGRGNARIAESSGTGFETIAPSGIGGLNAVFMDDADEAIVGGVFGFGGSFAPQSDELVREDTETGTDIHAIWGDGDGRYYAVGGTFFPPHEGVALVREVR